MSNIKRRGWKGKLNNTNNFLQWMYENGMTSTDQAIKDRVVRKYYRYYNDGDKPRGNAYTMYMSDDQIEVTLEDELTSVLTKLMRKYATVDNRRKFRASQLSTIFDMSKAIDTGRNRVSNLLDSYWAREFEKTYNTPGLKQVNDKIEAMKKQLAKLEAQAGRLIVDRYVNHSLATPNQIHIDIYDRYQR